MDIKLFSLMKGDAAAYSSCRKIIADCACSFTPQEEKLKNFSSPKRMMLAVSQALRSADAVIIAVQSSAYNSIKKMLCAAFNLELVQNDEIYAALLPQFEKKKITETAFKNNSMFPEQADIFAVSDYKCCGFSVTSGAQSIIIMPLDTVKTGEVVFGSLYEFLGEKAGVENTEDLSKLKRARIAAKLLAGLKKSGSTLAFTSLGGVQLIEETLDMVDLDRKYMTVADKPDARQATQSVQEYIVSAVQKTRETTGADYSCAVSSAFASNTDDSTFIYYAAADENDTFVTKLYAKKGETPKQLYRAAVENALLSCVNKINSNIAAEKVNSRKEDKLLRQKIAIIAAGSVAGATGICALLAALMLK